MLRDQRLVPAPDFGLMTLSLVASGLNYLSQAPHCQYCEANKREAHAFSYDACSNTEEPEQRESCRMPCQLDEDSQQFAMHGFDLSSRRAGNGLACEA
jgi:hypothetical protein